MTELFFKYVGEQCGMVTLIMAFMTLAVLFLWWLERKDRREAWKSRNTDVKHLLEVLNDQRTLLEVLKIMIQEKD